MYKHLFIVAASLVLLSLACLPLSTTPQSENILFEDDFSTDEGTWDVLTNDPEILLEYTDGNYRMTALEPGKVFSSVPDMDLPDDVRIEVDLSQTSGTYNTAMGIICRNNYTSEGNSMYFFMITNDGTAKIAKYIYNEKTQIAGNNDILPSIHTGDAINHLRVDCIGNQLSMYVNGTELFSIKDDSIPSGSPGLMIGTADEDDAVVLFDNFVVSEP